MLRTFVAIAMAGCVAFIPAASFAQENCADPDDCFLDAQGDARSASQAYSALHSYPDPHYLRAGLEETLFLGIGIGWYWIDRRNRADWDFPGLHARLNGEVLRYDNNTFNINFLWHPLSGGVYYTAARSNGMRLGPTLLYTIATPVIWEYVLEFRERVSINDLITTPVGGIALGEAWSRLALLVSRPARGHPPGQRFGAWTFGLLQTVHDKLDTVQGARGSASDGLGYAADPWHTMSAHAGLSLNVSGGTDALARSVSFDARFVAIPSYLRTGHFVGWFHDADVTRIALDAQFASLQQGEVDLFADTLLAGYYAQHIGPDRTGASVIIGTGVGYRYRRVDLPGFEDDLSVTYLPGLSLEVDSLLRHAWLHLSLRVGADFAGVKAWPFERWTAANPDERTKTVLHRYGYSYSVGGSTLASLELVFQGVRVGGSATLARYDSRQGLDRGQELLTTDVKTSNTILDTQGFLRLFPIPGSGFNLSFSLLARRRVSSVDTLEQQGTLLRASAMLGWLL